LPTEQDLTAALAGPDALPSRLREALARRRPAADGPDDAKPAGVLVPLRFHDGDWHVILNLRSQHVGEHKGEVAFPGGRLEPEDIDMRTCALRETWEEMGVRSEHVDILGDLSAVHTRTGYLVWPTVGTVPHPYDFVTDEREVAEVIEIPLSHLLGGTAVRHEGRLQPDGTVIYRPSYVHNDYVVYGATAWILEQLLDVVRALPGSIANE
jgi:8-oxo-dGTP pyrophosphatase MutT (NUDIX family)